jgi:hypothetical protein
MCEQPQQARAKFTEKQNEPSSCGAKIPCVTRRSGYRDGMKKIWFALIAMLALSSPTALASQTYFGIGFYSLYWIPIFPGVQVVHDFDSSNSGFGMRGSLASLLIFTGVSVDAYYRVPLDSSGLNTYLGAGVGGDLLLSLGAGAFSRWNVHGLIGLARPVNTAYWFVEAAPGAAFGNGLSGSTIQWSFYLNLAFGLNFPLR